MDDAIVFSLNEKRVEVRGAPPTTTLLDWLRAEGLVATKEGCAEGDCGACTVAIRSLGPEGDVAQRTANACIQLLPMLHGKEIVTVERLNRDGPHPVQQAMAAGGGSQCGFCTPGFVMSLWHGYETGASVEPDDVADQIAGNLCRCTGYGPILSAAAVAQALPGGPAGTEGCSERLAALGTRSLDYQTPEGRIWAPRTADEFAALYEAHPDATILAGATDIGLWVTKNGFAPAAMIYIGDCADLGRIETTISGGLRFGAAVSHETAAPALADLAPDLGELWRRFASPQVRGAGTLCGNIANGSPIGDAPPALIAVGATLTLRRGASRRSLPLEDFFLEYGRQDRAPGEFVESVEVARPRDPMDLRVYKISKRFDQDISSVLAAVHVRLDGAVVAEARIAFGGMAGVPKRAAAVEAALVGRVWSRETIETAMAALGEDFAPLSDHRASAAYRMRVARNLLLKYFVERASGDQRITGRARALAGA